jgi:hypothetical protein
MSSDMTAMAPSETVAPVRRPKKQIPAHYIKLHILFSKRHDNCIRANKPCNIPVENLHEDGSKGGRLTYLSTAQALAAQKCLTGKTKHFKYHPSLADIKFNTEQGGDWSSFSSWVSDRWNDAKDLAKEVLKYAPAILEFVSDILPATSPQLIALKLALKTASGLASKLDQLVNKTAKAKDDAEMAETEYETAKYQAKDAELDFKLSQKDKAVSDKEKARLKAEAEAAKLKAEKKKQLLKDKEAEAKRLEKEARDTQAKKKAADKAADDKAKIAEKAAKEVQKKKK